MTISLHISQLIASQCCLAKKSFVTNFCLLHAKYFIHKVRQNSKERENIYFPFMCYLQELKKAVIIEKQIAVFNMHQHRFDMVFHQLEHVLKTNYKIYQ